jgi:hypothetical protein
MATWVDMGHLCRCWVASKCDAKKRSLFDKELESRRKTSAFESACWGSLAKCGLLQESAHLKNLVRILPIREMSDGRLEIDLARQNQGEVLVPRPLRPRVNVRSRPRVR